MASPRVLILAPWPFRAPRNGGQIRGAAVEQAYRDAGYVVFSAAFYDSSRIRGDDIWPTDIPILPGVGTAMQAAAAEGKTSALTFWEAVAAADDSFAAFCDAVRGAQPDLLQFEEPFLWPVVRRLKSSGLLDRVRVAHSSHNFETAAWRDQQAAGASVDHATVRDIVALERDIATSCDLVITVSENDAREFRALGAVKIKVAPNGVSVPRGPGDKAALDAYLPSGAAYALFVSSAHPPNAFGLTSLARKTKHVLRRGELLVCGEVGGLVRASPHFQQTKHVTERARFLGWVDNDLLAALYATARVVILPKTMGGGSNLKTAEALASGRPVVATRLAFQGFERFADLPGVRIADDPDEFWTEVDALLSDASEPPFRSPASMAELNWRECLRPMVRAAEELLRPPY